MMNNNDHSDWRKRLDQILSFFNLKPNNYSKYLKAFTHSSYSYENNLDYNYERFEFLGDSAISWIISNFLFSQDDLSEGDMSIKKAKLVSSDTLSYAAKNLKLDELIFVGRGLQQISNKILENVFEAFIGVVANDLGIDSAIAIVQYCIINPYLEGKINTQKPYKTLIQELLMRSSSNEIRYVQDNHHDLHHEKVVRLVFNGQVYGVGHGATLKIAEEQAAKDAFNKLKY